MRIFHCDHCGNPVFFENTRCEKCKHKLAYLPDLKIVASLDSAGGDDGGGGGGSGSGPAPSAGGDAGDAPGPRTWTSPVPRAEGRSYRLCGNYEKYDVCNWAVPADDPSPLCPNCRLTRVIPDLSVDGNRAAWAKLELAKRRLVYSLMELRLPVRDRVVDPDDGLEFRFLADPPGGPRVLTGHDHGIITLNIAEADDVERERMRVTMKEPYRTLLGHFRHEVGHYYWDLLVKDSPRLAAFRELFGNEELDYAQALSDHYANGARPDWRERFVTEYASVHPWEDWAETWAHYLHMTDTLETAAVCGLSLQPHRADEPVLERQPPKPAHEQSFDEIIGAWFPLTYVLNNLNRGMGLADAYPFVLSPPTIEKLRFVHDTVCRTDGGGK